MEKRGWESRRLWAAVLTIGIISILVFSGPARAITLGIQRTDSSDDPDEQTSITFKGKVDIHSTDEVDIKAIVVLVDDTPDDSLANAKRCSFYLNGTAYSDNPSICDITISSITNNYTALGYGYGDAYGYAYKFSTGAVNTTNYTFNYGYRYGYKSGYGYNTYSTSLGSTAEIVVSFSWRTPEVATDTEYKVGLGVIAGEGSSDKVLFISGDSVSLTVLNKPSGGTPPRASSGTVSTANVALVNTNSSDVPEIRLVTAGPLSNPRIVVEEVPELLPQDTGFVIATPVQENKARLVYKYIKITASSEIEAKVISAKIKFRVEKSWLEANGVSASEVVLMRYSDGEWNPLPTSVLGSDSNYVNYEATTPGFSLFVVGIRKTLTHQPTVSRPPTQPVAPPSNVCAQVITYAIDPATKDCYEYSSPCDVPDGWTVVNKCPSQSVIPVVTPGLRPNEKLAVFLGVVVIILLFIWLFVYRRPREGELVYKSKRHRKRH